MFLTAGDLLLQSQHFAMLASRDPQQLFSLFLELFFFTLKEKTSLRKSQHCGTTW